MFRGAKLLLRYRLSRGVVGKQTLCALYLESAKLAAAEYGTRRR
jgi:hypothetical protein